MQIFYYTVGGLVLVTSAISFLYFTLFNYGATATQWTSALLLGGVGVVFTIVGNELSKNQGKV